MNLRQKVLFVVLISFLYGCSENDLTDDFFIEINTPIMFSSNILIGKESRGLPILSANEIQNIIVYADYTGNVGDSTCSKYVSTSVHNVFYATS